MGISFRQWTHLTTRPAALGRVALVERMTAPLSHVRVPGSLYIFLNYICVGAMAVAGTGLVLCVAAALKLTKKRQRKESRRLLQVKRKKVKDWLEKSAAGPIFSYKLRYIVGFWLVEMAISTNQKPAIYRNLYENTAPGPQHDSATRTGGVRCCQLQVVGVMFSSAPFSDIISFYWAC